MNTFIATIIVWKLLIILLNTPYPLVVVTSDSMNPSIRRGDVLMIEGVRSPTVYDVIVFSLPCRDMSIVHRVIYTDNNRYLTKGDNNQLSDAAAGIYCNYDEWPKRENVIGRVYGQLPLIGYPVILFYEIVNVIKN